MITFPRLGQSGRLGNQLWQIASTIGLAKKYGTHPSFPRWPYQRYFSIPQEYFSGGRGGVEAASLVPHLAPEAKDYLQDLSLWWDIRDDIHAWFQPSPEALQTIMQYQDFHKLEPPVLSMHVRRGDNANEGPSKADYHPLRPISYYLDAMQLRHYQSIAIFSDDIPWCKETFGDTKRFAYDGPSLYYHQGTPRPKEHEPEYATAPVLDWIDLQMMSMCDHHIISNSTYSWWGAFLSHDPSPIYPSPWYGRKLRPIVNADLMFPPEWTRVNHAYAD